MSRTFYIAHSTDGRTRIRWAGDPSEKSGIIEVAEKITGIRGVDQAQPRIATGSIVIEHEQMQWPALETRLVDELSLKFMPLPSAPNGLQTLNSGIDKVNAAFKSMNADLGSVTVLLFIALAITQAARGQVMGNAVSFLWYAMNIAAMSRRNSSPAPDAAADSND